MTILSHHDVLDRVRAGRPPSAVEALALADCNDLQILMATAAAQRDRGHGVKVSYSRKVFIPLTRLCRDTCHYCTFAQPPRHLEAPYLSSDEVLAIARSGQRAGCHEALFTLGDKPELRYRAARVALDKLGYASTVDYLAAMATLVLRETGLLPHLNPGVMSLGDIRLLRAVSASQGIMLETTSERLSQNGGPHFGSPDKQPKARLATIRAAGQAAVPFTSGILIGIGESRRERIEALLALRDLHDEHGHIQEIIVQNFCAKPGTRMALAPEPDGADHLWTVAVARILFGPDMNIQSPPNLSRGPLADLIAAGINDWGGISPVTPDHVNPEKPWPALEALARCTDEAGYELVERLAVYPSYIGQPNRWFDETLRRQVLRASDAEGFARTDSWIAGANIAPPSHSQHKLGVRVLAETAGLSGPAHRSRDAGRVQDILDRATAGEPLTESDIISLFATRGDDFQRVCMAADTLRAKAVGDRVAYVVNRNINYTNVCSFRCRFCAFSKGRLSANLRGRPYDLTIEEIQRRSVEAWDRGATEVCLQGGIHPDYTGDTYLDICRAIKEAAPSIHIHAFSPLEIFQGAQTLGMTVKSFLTELKTAGLGSLPGTAAEILDDEVRRIICPDKLTTSQWLEIVETSHSIGLRTTATIMFGHVDHPRHWARHLLHLRAMQARTGGLTEFVPLPYVPMETPIYLHGHARSGPTYREAVLMHAVARLALHPHVPNIQTSWVKMGPERVKACLNAGANDLGGTLMNESITRAAGAIHGEEMPPREIEELIRSVGRKPIQRTTLYGQAPDTRRTASFNAAPLLPPVNRPAGRHDHAVAAQ